MSDSSPDFVSTDSVNEACEDHSLGYYAPYEDEVANSRDGGELGGVFIRGLPWSEGEHKDCVALVKKHGSDWQLISSLLGTRTPRECQDRFGRDDRPISPTSGPTPPGAVDRPPSVHRGLRGARQSIQPRSRRISLDPVDVVPQHGATISSTYEIPIPLGTLQVATVDTNTKIEVDPEAELDTDDPRADDIILSQQNEFSRPPSGFPIYYDPQLDLDFNLHDFREGAPSKLYREFVSSEGQGTDAGLSADSRLQISLDRIREEAWAAGRADSIRDPRRAAQILASHSSPTPSRNGVIPANVLRGGGSLSTTSQLSGQSSKTDVGPKEKRNNAGSASKVSTETEPVETGLPCPHCHKLFRRHCDVAMHVKRRTRPYECSVKHCGYRIHLRRDLEKHMATHLFKGTPGLDAGKDQPSVIIDGQEICSQSKAREKQLPEDLNSLDQVHTRASDGSISDSNDPIMSNQWDSIEYGTDDVFGSAPKYDGLKLDASFWDLRPSSGFHKDENDSDKSEVESIMSEVPSLASSMSSIPMEVPGGALKELKELLLFNGSLKPLYYTAISRVGSDRFQRNLSRLLVRYGRTLGKEASTRLQSQAARFVRVSAWRVSIQIRDSISDEITPDRMGKRDADKANILDYLKDLKDSDDESVDDPEEAALQTLESVKSFLVSSNAFYALCNSFNTWLDPHDAAQHYKFAVKHRSLTNTELYDRWRARVKDILPDPTKQSEELGVNAMGNPTDTAAPCPTPCPPETKATRWLQLPKSIYKHARNTISDKLLRQVEPGYVRVSWTCRCGDHLHIKVASNRQDAALKFAHQAAGPNAHTVTSQTSSVSGLTNVGSQTSSSALTTDASTTGSSDRDSNPESPNTVPSDDENNQPEPFIPAGTKKFVLLCVNTNVRGISQRKLANVDVTDVQCSEEMFRRLQHAYHTLHKSRNPFLVPKTMHYVKFQLLNLQKSGECIGHYQTNSIPTRKQVLNQEYAFAPCPPLLGDLPMPPDIFMHAFLDAGDHLGPMAVEVLPKKLWRALAWDRRVHDHFNIPQGWGFYIVEGINWPLVQWCAAITLFGVTVLTVCWSVLMTDVQGGTGLGQYCLAVLALSVSVYLLKHSVRDRT